MPRDYSVAILPGDGETDYARYMRTDVLLSLQRTPEQMVHRDELLFQTVHQSTELWLKLACYEARAAAARIRSDEPDAAARLLARSSLAIKLITEQLEMLAHLAPWAFQTIRAVLGHGSGFESPGWAETGRVARDLDQAFREMLARHGIELVSLYQNVPDDPRYRMCEALMEWDERISVWRVRHYKIATRIIGNGVVGTKGTPVDTLCRLIEHKHFPGLWQVRAELTRLGPMGDGGGEAAP